MISPLFTKNTDMDLASHGVWNFICSILTSTLLRVIALCKGDLYTCNNSCCYMYLLWKRNVFKMCGVGGVFFFFYSVYLHLYILTICIFVQFHSFPKQCDIFFFSTLSNLFQYSNLWVYQSGLLYTCIYMYVLYLDMLSFVLLSLHLFILFYKMR